MKFFVFILICIPVLVLVSCNEIVEIRETRSSQLDDRDDQHYSTILIGDQIWMAENLNYEVQGSYCYDNLATNCQIYGRLYTWESVYAGDSGIFEANNTIQGICPNGWHLPKAKDWEALARYVSEATGDTIRLNDSTETYQNWVQVGKHLKAEDGWRSSRIGQNLDTYWFSALPGGYRFSNGDYFFSGEYGFWWTAEEFNSTKAYYQFMHYEDNFFSRYQRSKDYGKSVRCLKND